MLKKWKTFCAATVLLAGMMGTAYAEQKAKSIEVYYAPVEFVFDGEQYAPPEGQQAFIYEGTTYVPLRFISYSLNRAVQWDGNTYTVSVSEPKESDKLAIQEFNLNTKVRNGIKRLVFDSSSLSASSIVVYEEKVNYVFDGQAKEMQSGASGLFVNNNLYVPLRFFSESIGRLIEWNPASYTIAADSKPVVKEPVKEEKPVEKEPEKPEAKPETEKPVTPPAGGGGAIGGGVGSGSTGGTDTAKLQAEAEAKMKNLENSCRNKLTPLADQYLKEKDAAKKKQLIAQGQQILNQCTNDFNNILASVNGKLSDEVIQGYRDRFNQVQNEAIANLLSKLKS